MACVVLFVSSFVCLCVRLRACVVGCVCNRFFLLFLSCCVVDVLVDCVRLLACLVDCVIVCVVGSLSCFVLCRLCACFVLVCLIARFVGCFLFVD